jgi:hypothetical protein
MASTNLHERLASVPRRTDPTEHVSILLAFLLVLLGFAFASDAVEQRVPTPPAAIELEGAASESAPGTALEESRPTQPSRRLRVRDLERTIRIEDRPFEIAIVHAPSARGVLRVAIEPRAGRDLLILHRRFLI